MKDYVYQNHTTPQLKLKTKLIYNYYAIIPWIFITNFLGKNNYEKIMGIGI
jgi:hypothetical protein